MSISLDHIHEPDGKRCYVFRGRHRPSEAERLLLPTAGHVDYGGFSAGYLPYTGHWYIWDDEGRLVATINREFFEAHLRHFSIGALEHDPDCVVE